MNRLTVPERGEPDQSGAQGSGARARILVVGGSSPWLEGVVDLLQLAGYDALLLSDWQQAEREIQSASVSLAIVDLSEYLDSLDLPERLNALARGAGLPILLLNSTADDRIWHLDRVSHPGRGRVDLYAHSLLGPTALLDKVDGCLAPAAILATG